MLNNLLITYIRNRRAQNVHLCIYAPHIIQNWGSIKKMEGGWKPYWDNGWIKSNMDSPRITTRVNGEPSELHYWSRRPPNQLIVVSLVPIVQQSPGRRRLRPEPLSGTKGHEELEAGPQFSGHLGVDGTGLLVWTQKGEQIRDCCFGFGLWFEEGERSGEGSGGEGGGAGERDGKKDSEFEREWWAHHWIAYQSPSLFVHNI